MRSGGPSSPGVIPARVSGTIAVPRGWSSALRGLVLVALWSLAGLLYSVQIHQVGRSEVPGFPFALAALHAMPVWWIWLLLTPLVALLARRVPIRRDQVLRAAAFHMLASILTAFAVVVFAAFWFSLTPVFPERDRTFVEWLWGLSHATTLQGCIVSYWLIVGVVHVVDHERHRQRLEVAAAHRETLVAQARMGMLARQLQPHFLFSSLDALSEQIVRGDTRAAGGMLGALAEFLRATMRLRDRAEQPLHAELELVSLYLEVEKARLGERFRVRVEIDHEAEELPVPVLLLQSLVESMVRHDIAANPSGGELVIQARRAGEVIRLEIEGEGREHAAEWQERAEERFGLRPIRLRLRQAFGEHASLSLERITSVRTRLCLELPTRTDEGQAATAVSEVFPLDRPGESRVADLPVFDKTLEIETVSTQPPRWKASVVALVAGAWTLPGLLYAIQLYEIGLLTEPNFGFGRALLAALPAWWIWIPLTPLVAYFARRFPIRRREPLVPLLRHLAISLAVAIGSALTQAAWHTLGPEVPGIVFDFGGWARASLLSTDYHLNVFSYWLIVGVVHVLDHERHLRRLEVSTARREALVARTRLEALARQLQPHFLFNAMNALSTQILRGDTAAAQAMLGALTEFLRATLRLRDRYEHTLGEELELVSRFLAIEKARSGERLTVRVEVDRDAVEARVPVLLLQPLVENAVRYGVMAGQRESEIVIRAVCRSETVRLEIENDGPGLPADWRERMEERVGLSNTRDRLRETFGDLGRLEIEEMTENRVRVSLEFPLREQTAYGAIPGQMEIVAPGATG